MQGQRETWVPLCHHLGDVFILPLSSFRLDFCSACFQSPLPSSHRLNYNHKNKSIYGALLQNESINLKQARGQILDILNGFVSAAARGCFHIPWVSQVSAVCKHRGHSWDRKLSTWIIDKLFSFLVFEQLQLQLKTLFLVLAATAIGAGKAMGGMWTLASCAWKRGLCLISWFQAHVKGTAPKYGRTPKNQGPGK